MGEKLWTPGADDTPTERLWLPDSEGGGTVYRAVEPSELWAYRSDAMHGTPTDEMTTQQGEQ